MAKTDYTWETREERGVVVVRPLCREITFKNCKDFHSKTKDLIAEKKAPLVVLDLEVVDILDSLSLGVLVALQKHVIGRGGEVALARVGKTVGELFGMLNFNKVFDSYGTVEEAVEGMRAAADSTG